MLTHKQLVKKLLQRPSVREEVERIEREVTTVVDGLPSSNPPVNSPTTLEDVLGDSIDSDCSNARL